MKKAFGILLGVLSVIGVIYGAVYWFYLKEEPIEMNMQTGSRHVYQDLAQLEENADFIVGAVYGKKKKDVLHPAPDEPEATIELTKLVVKNVYKGDLEKEQEIWTTGSGFNKKGRYILFFYKSGKKIEGHDIYVLQGGYQGMYDLTITEKATNPQTPEEYKKIGKAEYYGEDAKRFNELKRQIVEKYSFPVYLD